MVLSSEFVSLHVPKPIEGWEMVDVGARRGSCDPKEITGVAASAIENRVIALIVSCLLIMLAM